MGRINSVGIDGECSYQSHASVEFKSSLEIAQFQVDLECGESSFSLTRDYSCEVDGTIPNGTLFEQVHTDTGYASDNPDVQSMAGMDEAAALLANRTDCGYDSELNFDALLLGGYFCHVCLPEQDQTCGGGGACQNVQWRGYICDNEFQIVANPDTSLPGGYLLQTMNGTTLDASELVLKPGVTYKFSMHVPDEEICLSTLLPAEADQEDSREDLKVGSYSRSRYGDNDGRGSVVTLGCATNGPVVWTTGDLALTVPQIYVNILGDPVFSLAMESLPGSSSSSSLLWSEMGVLGNSLLASLFGLLFLLG